jgi:transposase InsO family protein
MSQPENFHQLKLRFTDPIQHDYEVIRPIILFDETATERSRQTDIPRTTISETVRRFVEQGMLGLADQRAGQVGRKPQVFPEPVAAHILYLKQIYPPIHYREIVRIIERKFGYQTNHHTVKRFLGDHPIPVQLALDFTTFHDFEDAYQARWKVVRMYIEGWNIKSIAGCLKLSRAHVYKILEAFEQDEFAGLEDQRHRPADHPANQMSLPLLAEVLEIQTEYPRAGRFRVQGLLEERLDAEPPSLATVGRMMALNREFHGAPGPWSSEQPEAEATGVPKYLPYRPQYRHHLWFIDLRYLVQLEGGWVYSICILEGYSRKIVAGLVSAYQDLIAVLQLLRAALAEYGCPAGIVSDNGKVFLAHDYLRILAELAIEPLHIEKGRPWQNLIEAQFKVQLRLADAKFEQATSLEEVQQFHAEFIQTFNTTAHWAHRERDDGRRSPVDVLEWARGQLVELAELDRLFCQLQIVRTVNRFGFVSIQRFYIYAERGLARQRVSIWMYEGQLRLSSHQNRLAEYHYDYDRGRKTLKGVSQPTLYQTPFVSPQLELLELDDEQWHKVLARSYARRRKVPLPVAEQLPLLELVGLALLLPLPALLAEPLTNYFFPYVSTVL